MKKKLLPLAMLAGLAGAAGTAQAVHINTDGLGETLIYPYYSVEGGQNTYISLVNTTPYYKAVKVRFIEAENSQEVLDFNLYLSPEDVWTGAVVPEGDGAKVITRDNSCTVPFISRPTEDFPSAVDGELFRDAQYDGDGGTQGLARTREGYVEVIEMGVVNEPVSRAVNGAVASDFGDDVATSILHSPDGMPADCSFVSDAWVTSGAAFTTGPKSSWTASSSGFVDSVGTGEWIDVNAQDGFLQDAEATGTLGGLYGYGVLINPTEGTNATYSAVAIDAFYIEPGLGYASNHTDPGFLEPSLGNSDTLANIIDGVTVNSLVMTDGLDAISALFMHDTVSNDFVLDEIIQAETDWVITMPTKRDYVNNIEDADDVATNWDDTAARPPFTTEWTDAACEYISLEMWDREEAVTQLVGGIDFSPRPSNDEDPSELSLCKEVSVITFGEESALDASSRIRYGIADNVEHENGWARINLSYKNSSNDIRYLLAADETTALIGLPVTGFAVQKYTAAGVEGLSGQGGFYAGLIDHKYTRDIQAADPDATDDYPVVP